MLQGRENKCHFLCTNVELENGHDPRITDDKGEARGCPRSFLISISLMALRSKAHHNPTRREGTSAPVCLPSQALRRLGLSSSALAGLSLPIIKTENLILLYLPPLMPWNSLGRKDGEKSADAKEKRTLCTYSVLTTSSLKAGKTKKCLGVPFFELLLVLSGAGLEGREKGGPQTRETRLIS